MILFSIERYKYLAKELLKAHKFTKGNFAINTFINGEKQIELKTSVRGKECAVLGWTAPPEADLFSTMILGRVLKKEGAEKVIALIPYFGYSRQDKNERGKSFMMDWLGGLFKASGFDELVTVDLHSRLSAKKFPISLMSISPLSLFLKVVKMEDVEDLSIVAPDKGSLWRCEALSRLSGIKKIGFFEKIRDKRGIHLSKLKGRISAKVILLDDILDTGRTLTRAVQSLKNLGVREMIICATHGQFTGDKWKKLFKLGVKKIYTTDTVPENNRIRQVTRLSVCGLIRDTFKK